MTTTAPHRAALALSAALGISLSVAAERDWQSATFSGQQATLTSDQDLPTFDPDADQIEVPGSLVADIAVINPRQLQVLLIEVA